MFVHVVWQKSRKTTVNLSGMNIIYIYIPVSLLIKPFLSVASPSFFSNTHKTTWDFYQPGKHIKYHHISYIQHRQMTKFESSVPQFTVFTSRGFDSTQVFFPLQPDLTLVEHVKIPTWVTTNFYWLLSRSSIIHELY